MTIFLSCQTRALALLADRSKDRPLQDRSIGSVGGSTEKCTVATEISSCTRLERTRRRERDRNSAESSQPTALRRRRNAVSNVVQLPAKGSSIRLPSLVEPRRLRSRRATVFCVVCLPNFFSQASGGRISQ